MALAFHVRPRSAPYSFSYAFSYSFSPYACVLVRTQQRPHMQAVDVSKNELTSCTGIAHPLLKKLDLSGLCLNGSLAVGIVCASTYLWSE